MAVKLIKSKERLAIDLGGGTFFYRRMPADIKARLVRNCTKQGIVDWEEFGILALKWGTIGWKDVYGEDESGAAVPVAFQPEFVIELPENDVRLPLIRAISGGGDDGTADNADPFVA